MGLRRFVQRLVSSREETPDTREADYGVWLNGSDVRDFEPYYNGHVTRTFNATVADELTVERGAEVKVMYREDDWIYVEGADGQRGFVPQDYCKVRVESRTDSGKMFPSVREQSQTTRKDTKRQRKRLERVSHGATIRSGDVAELARRWEKSNLERFLESLPVKKEEGQSYDITEMGCVEVLGTYEARQAGDLSVSKREKVMVLNISDPSWTLVANTSKEEGFVPAILLNLPTATKKPEPPKESETKDLLVVKDFKSRQGVDLAVKHGDWVNVALTKGSEWTWATRVSDGASGFVPIKVLLQNN